MSRRRQIKFARPDRSLCCEPGRLVFNLVDDDDSERATLNISGIIGDSREGVDAGTIVPLIQQTKKPITMRLNTPGGLVFDALDIHDAISNHPFHTRADIVAEAWSAGTILSSAADETRIAESAVFGVHRAWSGFMVLGNSEELRDQMKQVEANIQSLEKLDSQIAKLIADRTGNTVDDVMEWMIGDEGVDGTEFTGQEAVDVGLVDSLIPNRKKKKSNSKNEYPTLRQAARKRAIQLARERVSLTV